MAYLLLIHEPRGQRETRTRAQGEEAFSAMTAYAEELERRGVLKTAQSLAGDDYGVRIAKRAGKVSLHDGPFAETKEMVGGFFLLDNVTNEEAIDIAANCPAAGWATVEVRPIGACFANLT
jgi:hypothetical protein